MEKVSVASPLYGLRVAVLQTRYAAELTALIERAGGQPLLAPCMREVRNEDDDELRERLRDVAGTPPDMFVFQTGVGTQALFDLAAEEGLRERLAEVVQEALVVARGPKPLTVLLRLGFRVDMRTMDPHTTGQLLWLLQDLDLSGRRVAVQHYGSANLALVEWLRGRGAEAVELFSYRWALPTDVGPILRFLDQLRDGRVDVTTFTNASQVENLFTVAVDAGSAGELAGWLNERTVTAVIGPVCARALEQHGVAAAVQPQRAKMVPFLRAVVDHFSAGGGRGAATRSPRRPAP
jgi:uroporphyrinogen-III synthase